jgi:hypothetical protein
VGVADRQRITLDAIQILTWEITTPLILPAVIHAEPTPQTAAIEPTTFVIVR